MKKFFQAWFAFFRQHADKWWCGPLIALTAFADLFILVIPTDALLITASLLAPRRWWWNACFVALGSALGATALSVVVHHEGITFLLHLAPNMEHTAAWRQTLRLTREYGPWALGIVSLSPLPQHPAVAMAALGDVAYSQVFLLVLAARLMKYNLLTILCAFAPKLVERFWGIKPESQEKTA